MRNYTALGYKQISHEQRRDFSICHQGPAESQRAGIWGAGRLHACTMPWVTVVLVFLK